MKPTLIVATIALTLAACTEAQPPSQTAASIKSAPPPSSCPLGVQGARVIYEDTDTGGRLTFTAPPEQLDALRIRARHAAAMHGPGERKGEGHDGRHGMGDSHGLRAMQMPPAHGTEEDLDGGARVTITPSQSVTLADRLLFVNGRLLAFSADGVVVLRREGESGTAERWDQLPRQNW